MFARRWEKLSLSFFRTVRHAHSKKIRCHGYDDKLVIPISLSLGWDFQPGLSLTWQVQGRSNYHVARNWKSFSQIFFANILKTLSSVTGLTYMSYEECGKYDVFCICSNTVVTRIVWCKCQRNGEIACEFWSAMWSLTSPGDICITRHPKCANIIRNRLIIRHISDRYSS